jgi:hypothetical protein
MFVLFGRLFPRLFHCSIGCLWSGDLFVYEEVNCLTGKVEFIVFFCIRHCFSFVPSLCLYLLILFF